METTLSTEDTETARALRHALVDELKQRGTIKAERIEAAFRAVPRHLFLPGVSMEEVYQDAPIITRRVGDQPTSSSSQPGVMASMLEQLDVQPGQRILEIGAGTGYNAALLAYLAGPEGQITTIDLDQDIVDGARARLAVAGFGDIEVICGDGWQGYSANAPYDGIIVTARVEDIAPAWWDQLAEGGRLVVPLVLLPRHLQPVFPWTALITFRKTAEQLISVSVENCGFLPLRGPSAHPLPAPVSLSGDVTVALADEYQGDRTALALAVNAPGTDVVANVEAAPGELVGLALWLALCDRNACALSARSSWYGTGVQPYLGLRSGEETLQVTIGSASAAGLAVMLGRPIQAGPDDETSQVVVRRFGSDATLVPRLLDCIHCWDRAGRPFKYASFVDVTTGDPALRIRAYPPHSTYTPAADELSVQKRGRVWSSISAHSGTKDVSGRTRGLHRC